MGPRDRVWGYTGASGMVQAFAAGYFLWDLVTSAGNLDVHGPGALMHAASALAVSLLGFVSLLARSGRCLSKNIIAEIGGGGGERLTETPLPAAVLQLLRTQLHSL